jgi:hypothetical protein
MKSAPRLDFVPITQNNIIAAVKTAKEIFPYEVEDGIFLPGDIYITAFTQKHFGNYFLAYSQGAIIE